MGETRDRLAANTCRQQTAKIALSTPDASNFGWKNANFKGRLIESSFLTAHRIIDLETGQVPHRFQRVIFTVMVTIFGQ